MIAQRIQELSALGQVIWLDNIRRTDILSGNLRRWIDEIGIRGETSNPSIFQKAISTSTEYVESIRSLYQTGKSTEEVYETVAMEDVGLAADQFAEVYEASHGQDGMVSIEVSPHLAFDTQGTIAAARRIYQTIGRPNVMIKIPGTREGILAVEECIYEGIPVNATLIFSVESYEEIAWAYIRGLERRVAEGKPINKAASVASFFISRIDTVADKKLFEVAAKQDPSKANSIQGLKGQMGIANARKAYGKYKEIFGSPRYQRLINLGANVQRPLWASTSTKNPDYNDVYYMDSLIGADTVNTTPLETIQAFVDHGKVACTLGDEYILAAGATLQGFDELGIHVHEIAQDLLVDGVKKFVEAYDQLLDYVAKVA